MTYKHYPNLTRRQNNLTRYSSLDSAWHALEGGGCIRDSNNHIVAFHESLERLLSIKPEYLKGFQNG